MLVQSAEAAERQMIADSRQWFLDQIPEGRTFSIEGRGECVSNLSKAQARDELNRRKFVDSNEPVRITSDRTVTVRNHVMRNGMCHRYGTIWMPGQQAMPICQPTESVIANAVASGT